MMKDLKNSIQSILYERISSPFFGTLITSWLIWNWKIVYLTFFIKSGEIKQNKIEYIISNYSDTDFLVWLPLLSTTILITIIPFITNGAYWINLKFEQWKVDKKKEIQKKQLLTLEQSIQLREQILDTEKRFENLLSDKNEEINQLKGVIENLKETPPSNININPNFNSDNNSLDKIIELINQKGKLQEGLTLINRYIQGGYTGLVNHKDMTSEVLSFFESNNVIRNEGKGMYELTEFGKKVNKVIAEQYFKE